MNKSFYRILKSTSFCQLLGVLLASIECLSLFRIRPYTLVKLCVTILIGVTVGVLAVGLALGTEKIIGFKNEVARRIIHDGRPLGVLRAALFHIGFSSALVIVGSTMVCLTTQCC